MANLDREFTSIGDVVATTAKGSLSAATVGALLQVGLNTIEFFIDEDDHSFENYVEYIKPTVAGVLIGTVIGTGICLLSTGIDYYLNKR